MSDDSKNSASDPHLSELHFEPGAARFGNFINYYSFNSVSKRLNAIPPDLLSQLGLRDEITLCLDIGCNSGELTIGVYSHLTSFEVKPDLHVLGIDLDDVLISRSIESNNFPTCIQFKKINFMEENAISEIQTFLHHYDKSNFDLVCCFSTTMWIHLNYGDDGIKKFLNKISEITRFLLLEPQEWKCYKAAARRMIRLNQEAFSIKNLTIKNISHYIQLYLKENCAMELTSCFGETSWGRKLYLFKKQMKS